MGEEGPVQFGFRCAQIKKTNPKQFQIPVGQRLSVVCEMVQKYTGQVSQCIAA